MTEQEKAKILLQYGSYVKYILKKLDRYELSPEDPVIEDMIQEEFLNNVDPEDIAEELRDHEDTDIDEDDIEECTFSTWQDAWEFYEDNVIEEVVQKILNAIDLDLNDIELSNEVYKIVEEEAGSIQF